ncbi:site-2 protease family protein [Bradyrhizobium sp. SZCCHNRI3043]|uniref:site-2 protease family protein n=1 Tax=Bradyrhizobium sp. SZCCHNRI3043 TaxID=3057292 RepID=UPI0039656C49
MSGGTMLLSLVVYAGIWGWRYAAGFIALLFAHEMGHYIAARQRGLDVGAPAFIPFVGAWIALKEQPVDVETEAYVALAGPLVGTAAALCGLSVGAIGRQQSAACDRLFRSVPQPVQPAADLAAGRRPRHQRAESAHLAAWRSHAADFDALSAEPDADHHRHPRSPATDEGLALRSRRARERRLLRHDAADEARICRDLSGAGGASRRHDLRRARDAWALASAWLSAVEVAASVEKLHVGQGAASS